MCRRPTLLHDAGPILRHCFQGVMATLIQLIGHVYDSSDEPPLPSYPSLDPWSISLGRFFFSPPFPSYRNRHSELVVSTFCLLQSCSSGPVALRVGEPANNIRAVSHIPCPKAYLGTEYGCQLANVLVPLARAIPTRSWSPFLSRVAPPPWAVGTPPPPNSMSPRSRAT